MLIVQNAKYLKIFNVSSELVALWSFYQSVVQCLILQNASRVQSQSYCGTSTRSLLPQKSRLHTSMTLQTEQEHGELYSLQVEIQLEL